MFKKNSFLPQVTAWSKFGSILTPTTLTSTTLKIDHIWTLSSTICKIDRIWACTKFNRYMRGKEPESLSLRTSVTDSLYLSICRGLGTISLFGEKVTFWKPSTVISCWKQSHPFLCRPGTGVYPKMLLITGQDAKGKVVYYYYEKFADIFLYFLTSMLF